MKMAYNAGATITLVAGGITALIGAVLIWDGFAVGAISGKVSPAFYGMFVLVGGLSLMAKAAAQRFD
jgi:hypothetical protein